MKLIILIIVSATMLCACGQSNPWKYNVGDHVTSCVGGFRGVVTAIDDDFYNGPHRYYVRYPTISMEEVHVIEPEMCPAKR